MVAEAGFEPAIDGVYETPEDGQTPLLRSFQSTIPVDLSVFEWWRHRVPPPGLNVANVVCYC